MNPAPKRRVNQSFWLRLAGTLLALALLVYLLGEQGWDEILQAMQNIPIWQLLLALALNLSSRIATCGRWHVLLRGARLPVRLSQTVRITFAGLFASNFLPTTIGGDVVRLAGALQLRFDGGVSAASLVADRLVGMAGMALALPFGLPAFNAAFHPPHGWHTSKAILSLSALSWDKRLEHRIKKLLRALTLFVQHMLESLKLWITRPVSLLAALGLTWGHMLCHFASIWLLLQALGDPLPFWLIAGMWSVVYFITLVPISINGYGLQEVSLAFVFTRVGGIALPNALSLAILVRTLFMISSLPGAIFVPGILAARSAAPGVNPDPVAMEDTPTERAHPRNPSG